MAERAFEINDMRIALEQRQFPTVTVWNRLESRPRAENFTRALSAELRDPLWMLTRQWQMGEFEADDAGSPITAQIRMHTTRLTGYEPAGHPARPLRDDVPLEALVAQQPLTLRSGGHPMSYDVRLLMGRQWLKLLAKYVGDFGDDFRGRYGIAAPDPADRQGAAVTAHVEGWQRIQAVATRMMDGHAFYEHLKAGGDAIDGIPVPPAQQDAVREVADRFVGWFEELFLQPAPEDDAWSPPRLEYGFSVTAPKQAQQLRYTAEEYHQGWLDWFSVDTAPATAAAGPGPDPQERTLLSFIPTAVSYQGMPNTRWWAFEEGKTNFGQIAPGTTELGKLLFIEFGLVYANDWFLLPHTIPAGSIAEIEGLVVTDVFGERTWVEAAGGAGQPWAMYRVSKDDPAVLILPTVPKVQEGPPSEDVAFVRDEMANMAWAVESTVPLPTGEGKPGREAARETAAFHARIVAGQDPAAVPALPRVVPAAPIAYRVMSPVDENWIPFVPIHVDGDNREIQLQRAAMPRVVAGDEERPRKIEPRTGLVRAGLDAHPPRTYHLYEEIVSRTGARATRGYQRARWYGGRAVTWFGTRRLTGRGSGSSGLVFDYLEDTPPDGP